MLMALVLVLAACSNSSSAAESTAGTTPSPTVGTSIDTVVVADESTSVGDAGSLLTEAIAAVGTRYEFDSSVDLTGGTLTLVAGRIYDDSSAFLITTVGSELEYVITPQGRWVREPDDQWVVLQEGAPVADPLSPLANPTAIEVLAADDTTVTLAATYAGETLGFPEANQVSVELVIAGSRLISLRYQTAVGQDIATVETIISTSLDIEPVVAPVPTG